MASIIHEIRKYPQSIDLLVLSTGQHCEMLAQVIELFDIRPDFDLKTMRENQSLAQVTSRILDGLEPVLLREKPDWMLVQGDTTTAMTASLLAHYHRINLGHVEAGLRTYNKREPFPEEINRAIVDLLADIHFAPTTDARSNLVRNGVPESGIHVTGNTVIDALRLVLRKPVPRGSILEAIPRDRRVLLVTTHRRENFGEPLQNICAGVLDIANRFADVQVVFPVHPNSNVKEIAHALLGGHPSIMLVDPMDYRTFVHVMSRAYLILTDSGGIQEEAPSLRVPVLVLREFTERGEAVDLGAARLVGTDRTAIFNAVSLLLSEPEEYAAMQNAGNPFGDGFTSGRIVRALLDYKL